MYDGIESQAQLLVTWVKEMQAIVTNPYSNGLNIERVLKDLQGFADNLYSEVQKLKPADVVEAEVTEKAE
jgi:hypothetical protein